MNSIDGLQRSLEAGSCNIVLPRRGSSITGDMEEWFPSSAAGRTLRANEMVGGRQVACVLPQLIYLTQHLAGHVSQHDASPYAAGVANPAASMRIPV